MKMIHAALHDLDPAFRTFSRSEKVADLLKSLGYKRPLPVQSMYIFKQPKIGGEVRVRLACPSFCPFLLPNMSDQSEVSDASQMSVACLNVVTLFTCRLCLIRTPPSFTRLQRQPLAYGGPSKTVLKKMAASGFYQVRACVYVCVCVFVPCLCLCMWTVYACVRIYSRAVHSCFSWRSYDKCKIDNGLSWPKRTNATFSVLQTLFCIYVQRTAFTTLQKWRWSAVLPVWEKAWRDAL